MKDFNTLILFGQAYTSNELMKKAKNLADMAAWERDFYTFIEAWFNEEDHIQVQTSGSTGQPKIIHLAKAKMLASAQMTCTYFDLKAGNKALLCMSPKHIGGMMMIVRALYAQLDLYFVEPKANPLKNLNEFFDFIAIVPYQAKKILAKNSAKLQAVKQVLIGGGIVDMDLEAELISNDISAFSSFGMTETISHFAIRKIGTQEAFECLPGIELALSEAGTMKIHAPMLHEDWIETNDLIILHSPTSFSWLGRADFAIETGGIKVIPEQVEKLLYEDISSRFFVSSLPHSTLNNQVVLLIEGKKKKFDASIFEKLGKYQKPKQIFFVEEFEETASGKIDRNKTKALLRL